MTRGKIKELIAKIKEIPGRRLFAALFVLFIAVGIVSADDDERLRHIRFIWISPTKVMMAMNTQKAML